MDISNEQKESIVDRVYTEYSAVLRVIDHNGRFITEFPVSRVREPPFDVGILEKNGWILVETGQDVRDSDTITAICGPFWTCNCKHKFVRHIGDPICEKCGIHMNNSTIRLPGLSLDRDISGFNHNFTYIN